jgi:hypothetical protein
MGGLGRRSYKTGSLPGTVPKTGKALIHKGEVVVPAKQVDPELMRWLVADAARKGTLPRGRNKNSKGYGCGSLKRGYQGGSMDEDAFWQLYNEMRSGVAQATPGQGATTGASIGGGPMANLYRSGAMEELADLSKRDKLTLQRALDDAAKGGKNLTQYTKYFKGKGKWGIVAALGAGALAVGSAEFGGPPSPKGTTKVLPTPGEYRSRVGPGRTARDRYPRQHPGGIVPAPPDPPTGYGGPLGAALGLGEELKERVTRPPEREGGGIMRMMGRAGEALEPVGRMLGYGEAPPQEPDVAPVAPAPPSSVPYNPAQARGSLGLAASRVKQGDLGTPERPLELIGVPSEREEAFRDLSGMYEQKRDQHEGAMLELRAKQTMDRLSKWGHTMDKDTYNVLNSQAKMDMALAQDYKKRVREREKSLEEELKASTELSTALAKIFAKEQAMGERQVTNIEKRAEQTRINYLYKGQAASLPGVYKTATSHSSAARRAEAMAEVATILQNLQKVIKGESLSMREADEMVQELMEMPPEEAQEFFQRLQEKVRATGG